MTVPRWAVASAVLSPIVITAAYLIAGVFQPPSYDPIRETISGMAGYGGTDRWIMTGGIFLVGACYLLTAAGLSGIRTGARVLLGIAGLAGIGIAVCPEPAHGSAIQHVAWTTVGAIITTIWPAFTGRRTFSGSHLLTISGSVAVTVVFGFLTGWLFIQTRDGTVLGLAERLTTSIQTSWPGVVSVALRRRPG
jgi:hypothetical membrane protein